MANLTVMRPVALRVIVTEQFKQEMDKELQEAADSAQRRLDQIDFQARRVLADLQRADLNQAMQVRQQIEAEKGRQESVKKELLERAEEVRGLELGSEFPRGTIESMIEIKEGDNLYEKLTQAEIVIKDGIVTEIRDPRK
ncbi:MAG: YlqD family protein [Armatimonadota bacterium]|nr:MAG: YlqD family protein [Armatimonadota bacterium]